MVSVVYTIDDAKLADFKLGFLKTHPIPQNSGLSDNQWIKEWGLRQFKAAYIKGKFLIAEEALSPGVDSDIIA